MPWYRTTLPGILAACYLSLSITVGMVETTFADIWPDNEEEERDILLFKTWISGSCQNGWICCPPKLKDCWLKKSPVRRLIFVLRRTVVIDGVLQPKEKVSCQAYCYEDKEWRKKEATQLALIGSGSRKTMGI